MNRGAQASTAARCSALTTAGGTTAEPGTAPFVRRSPRVTDGGPPATARSVRAGALGLGVAVTALVLLAAVARRGLGATGGTARPDDVLLVLLAWVGVLLAAWLALGCLLGLAALLPGTAGRVAGQVAERVTPVAVRKVLTLVLGASVGSMALPPAAVSSADTGPTARDAGGQASSAAPGLSPGYTPTDVTPGYTPTDLTPGHTPTDLTPGYTPTDLRPGHAPPDGRSPAPAGPPRSTPGASLPALPDPTVGAGPGYAPTPAPAPQGTGAPAPPSALTGPGYVPTRPAPVHDADRSRLLAPAPRPVASAHDLVTVRRGDSLWAIAARHLGPGASDAQVAHEWPRWYAANRDVVGEDPDLLVPGLQLRPPSSAPAPAAASRSTSPHPSVTHPGVGSGAAAEQGAR
ncbi:LysM domain-containing protein [Terrabacter sp. Soil810]|uniref:LysM peptidoglycan-binding domain-containing protein n=1 Tax=Terrabacter sp. Soil810 TaxID=1736418 RepID=UPI00070DD6D4|nr:LysM domain-containing protein [Terrabacter sp. Soil810]KRF40551.1 hypothetical protein ASG96_06710 [Terrabacter sp. Soil810]